MNSFLVIPACEKGRGGGHLYRSIALVNALRAGGGDAWLFTDNQHHFGTNNSDSTAVSKEFLPEGLRLDKEKVFQKKWTLIVLDRFRTKRDELQRWFALAPVLGIDEGLSRKECDFLIDLLPQLPKKAADSKPNLCAPSLLFLPAKRRPAFNADRAVTGPNNILVSFGAEDTAGLTVSTAFALKNAAAPNTSLTVVLGPLRKNNDVDRKLLEEAGITVIEAVTVLQEKLADYDLLITHFGLTAFEALHARVPVLLINPSAYHDQLSRYAGLPTFLSLAKAQRRKGIKKQALYLREEFQKKFTDYFIAAIKKSEEAALRWLNTWNNNEKNNDIKENSYTKTLAEFLLGVKPVIHRNCPLCGNSTEKVVGRFPDRTYRLCSCGTITMDRLTPLLTEYNRDYFFSEYQKQYGKTYLEDFPRLQLDGERRLRIISNLLALKRNAPNQADVKRNTPNRADLKRNAPNVPANGVVRLLDIGCAYGPFLAAARDRGYEVMGIDPAPDAVDYIKKTLKINAVEGFFPEALPKLYQAEEMDKDSRIFNVITLWYVLEHFENPGKTLRAINALLTMGGILAFSTPSAAGISRRKSLGAFLERSPADHWTIWDPRRTAAVLSRYGFRLKKRVITGHHPERFPHILSGFRFTSSLSRIFGLGDTFEAYAVKVRDCGGANHD